MVINVGEMLDNRLRVKNSNHVVLVDPSNIIFPCHLKYYVLYLKYYFSCNLKYYVIDDFDDD